MFQCWVGVEEGNAVNMNMSASTDANRIDVYVFNGVSLSPWLVHKHKQEHCLLQTPQCIHKV